ncbi:ADP-dependent glucokinase/phosphofructokinase [Ruegeria hyattellae]|uniref:ADP-dependent glucokinase/phosphofructokinase n=1 Tax=Ruegeria hyattellae TaxID=3233337 RepID=UPI00355BC951
MSEAQTDTDFWNGLYQSAASDAPIYAANAPVVLGLSNACVDAICRLKDLSEIAPDSGSEAAKAFFETLLARASMGKGGEIRSHWADGPRWLRDRLPVQRAIGGTGPQAAWALSAIGAPALVALGKRYEGLLTILPAGVHLALEQEMVEGRFLSPTAPPEPEIFIFEFSAGETIAAKPIPRSSRIIVRFDDPGLERDREFEHFSANLRQKTVALVGGLGSVPVDRISNELAYLEPLTATWRANGIQLLHLELGGYCDKDALASVLDRANVIATSIGMSAAEFPDVSGDSAATPETMLACATRLGVTRLCVHADEWAASVSRNAANAERDALIFASLLAAARAERGQPTSVVSLPVGARFHDPPFASRTLPGGWTYVSVATPYLQRPRATIGLGDTFSAGCLMVLGQRQAVKSTRN